MKVLDEGFFKRLTSSFDRVLFGLDLALSIFIVGVPLLLRPDLFNEESMTQFVQSGSSLTITLIIVTVTSVSILVSLSNSSAIQVLKREGLYGKFLFTFEYTALLALFTSAAGVVAQSFGYLEQLFPFFFFLFTYTILATATVISRLITYGDKVAQISFVNSIPDLDERVSEVRENEEVADEGKVEDVEKN